jgi:hypothetical protein
MPLGGASLTVLTSPDVGSLVTLSGFRTIDQLSSVTADRYCG